jgi:hypothetical protein
MLQIADVSLDFARARTPNGSAPNDPRQVLASIRRWLQASHIRRSALRDRVHGHDGGFTLSVSDAWQDRGAAAVGTRKIPFVHQRFRSMHRTTPWTDRDRRPNSHPAAQKRAT